ncbi:hypothetical protein D5F52_19540 [Brevibacillus laterosporus]|nr:hypothetical protein D5F52_19540 [Brevibacillus laterosporus]
MCLKELWDISFEQDQCGPQRLMESLLRRKSIPQQNIEPFAEFLMESKSKYASRIIDNGRLSEIDPTIRTALFHIIEQAEKLNEEYR